MLIGDRGGPTTKIAVVPVCRKGQNNSPKNCMILALWQGNDDRQSLEKVAPLFEQLATIKAKWSVSFILVFKKMFRLISGDLLFLKSLMGHKGHQSNFPCLLCRTPKENLDQAGAQRTFDQTEEDFSFDRPSLFPVTVNQIVPPSLHITHGISNRVMELCEILIGKNSMNDFLKKKHIRRDQHTQKFQGKFDEYI